MNRNRIKPSTGDFLKGHGVIGGKGKTSELLTKLSQLLRGNAPALGL